MREEEGKVSPLFSEFSSLLVFGFLFFFLFVVCYWAPNRDTQDALQDEPAPKEPHPSRSASQSMLERLRAKRDAQDALQDEPAPKESRSSISASQSTLERLRAKRDAQDTKKSATVIASESKQSTPDHEPPPPSPRFRM